MCAGSRGMLLMYSTDDRVVSERNPVVWFEVEDLLRYFDHFPNPTGSQRVPLEIFVQATKLYGREGRVGFCRLSAYTKRLVPIDVDAVMEACLHPCGALAPWKAVWEPAQLMTCFPKMVPVILANPRFFFRIAMGVVRDFGALLLRPRAFANAVRRGDTLVSLGASWAMRSYARHIAVAKRRYGVAFKALVYDMIPIENGDFVEPQHTARFREWLTEIIPVADALLTISDHSRQALHRFGVAERCPMPRVDVIRLGGDWHALAEAAGAGDGVDGPVARGPVPAAGLPARYVLFVSTIEVRKNHRLMVRVWRRLIERHDRTAVPILVCVGRLGWMVDDLLADLDGLGWLDGGIEHRPGLSDRQLGVAYDRCLFTVFPSFAEGWGLPVAESLAHGKFCVASSATSIPEIGGDLIDYFDPGDEDEAVSKIERVLFEPGYLAAREARLRMLYRPVTWADCARSVVLGAEQQAVTAMAATARASDAPPVSRSRSGTHGVYKQRSPSTT